MTTVTAPRNLDQLRAMPPGPERVKAAKAYVAERREAIKQALALRDDDVRDLVAKHGLAKTRDLTGLSYSTVKLIRGRPAESPTPPPREGTHP